MADEADPDIRSMCNKNSRRSKRAGDESEPRSAWYSIMFVEKGMNDLQWSECIRREGKVP